MRLVKLPQPTTPTGLTIPPYRQWVATEAELKRRAIQLEGSSVLKIADAPSPAWEPAPDRSRLTRRQRIVAKWFQAFASVAGGFTHWTTLTFNEWVYAARAKHVTDRWLRRIAERAGQHYRYVYVIEQEGREAWHLHLLAAFPEGFDHRLGHALWVGLDRRAGFTDIERFHRGGGAAFYVASKRSEFEVGIACPRRPCCRRAGKGCIAVRRLRQEQEGHPF